ncbi:MAG: hypothetical protein KDA80_23135 [Planctomycetaceae bacterium]|nr:hypothetical protein [Planctomycetaceae bacterium]
MDDALGRTDSAPENFASVRNAAIGWLRKIGESNIAAALQKNALKVNDLLSNLGII